MKKYSVILSLFLMVSIQPSVNAQDAVVMVPYLESMVRGLLSVTNAIEENEEELKNIKKVMTTVKDFNEFMKHAVAVREAINMLACLGQNMTELEMSRILVDIGAPTDNIFSDFMTCQYDIYYSTLEIDYNLIRDNIERAFDVQESLNLNDRIHLINDSIRALESIHFRTISAKGALLEVLHRHIEIKQAEKYYSLMSKI